MSIRKVLLASVCTALLAAFAAVSGVQAASSGPAAKLAEASYKALSEGRPDDAIAGYTEVLASKKLGADAKANALLNRALAYQQAGNFEASVDDYSMALNNDDLAAQLKSTALYNRGLAYQKLNRQALAVEDFTSALFENPDFSHAYYARGNALRDAGQFLFALSDFDKALRYDYPNPHLVYYGQAMAFEQLRRPGEAAKSLNLALAAKPDFEPARRKLALLNGMPVQAGGVPEAANDKIVVGSVIPEGDDQVVRKPALPKAIEPPQEPMAEQPVSERIQEPEAEVADVTGSIDAAAPAGVKPQKKLFTARITATEEAAAPKVAAKADEQKPAAEPEKLSGWTIQISSAKDEDVAWSTWKKLKARHKLLDDQKPLVERAELGTRGTFYRLKLQGFEELKSAKSMCAQLKARGVTCFVDKSQS